ncbi:hypothetical protein [Stutzerimonas kunmingensis]|uniref:hypothetical protein n=1 Tax=Stutzerimonas kunmingensis TaxID=1211807 RepID=UPI0028A87A04|nr:hypothetical protein [Stutzerimonas kunmingensis]
MSPQKKKSRKTPPMNLTIPEELQAGLNDVLALIDLETYEDRKPSRSTICAVLIELVLEKKDLLKPENIVDYDSLRAELERILHEQE